MGRSIPDNILRGELLHLAREPGCVVCRAAHAAVDRFFAWYRIEQYHEPSIIYRMQEAHGFCPEHTRQLVATSSPHLVSTVYRDLLGAAANLVRSAARESSAPPEMLASRLRPQGACLACEHQEAAVDWIARGLPVGLTDGQVRAAIFSFITPLIVAMLIPVLTAYPLPFAFMGDMLAGGFILSLGGFFTSLGAMDTASTFGGMGSSRARVVSFLAEPVVILVLFSVALIAHVTIPFAVNQTLIAADYLYNPAHWLLAAALFMVILAETGRIPVDNPSTTFELSMIEAARTIEYSGQELALLEWGGAMRFFVLLTILLNVLTAPWGLAPEGGTNPLAVLVAVGSLLLKMLVICGVIVVIESSMAKWRFFRIPEFLGAALILAALAIVSFYLTVGQYLHACRANLAGAGRAPVAHRVRDCRGAAAFGSHSGLRDPVVHARARGYGRRLFYRQHRSVCRGRSDGDREMRRYRLDTTQCRESAAHAAGSETLSQHPCASACLRATYLAGILFVTGGRRAWNLPERAAPGAIDRNGLDRTAHPEQPQARHRSGDWPGDD